MDWNHPFNSGEGRVFGANDMRWSSVKDYEAEETTKKSEGILSRIKKPFMPSTWKWMRTSGNERVFNYRPRLGEISTVRLDIPSQFTPYLVNSQKVPFRGRVVEMDEDSYLTLGKRITVSMEDSERGKFVSTTFPSLEFKTSQESGGEIYQLDWQLFAKRRVVAKGAWDEDWGYPSQGKPTLGPASMYDQDLKMTWNSKLNWTWVLLAVLGLLGLSKLLRKQRS
jgi:hypothetical protein